jgi:hypothetical protein
MNSLISSAPSGTLWPIFHGFRKNFVAQRRNIREQPLAARGFAQWNGNGTRHQVFSGDTSRLARVRGNDTCRIADTRDGGFPAGFRPPMLSGTATRTFAIQSPSSLCPVPSIAQAYSFKITVVPPGATFPVTPLKTRRERCSVGRSALNAEGESDLLSNSLAAQVRLRRFISMTWGWRIPHSIRNSLV